MKKFQCIEKKDVHLLVIDDYGMTWLDFCIPKKYKFSVVKINNVIPYVGSFSFFYSLIESITNTGFKSTSLLSAIVKELNPKVIITHTDDNRFMGVLQSLFPDLLIISIQNGTRKKSDFNFKVSNGQFNFPHFFAFGSYELSLMRQLGANVKKYYSYGSFKMGIFLTHYYQKKKQSNKLTKICLISQYVEGIFKSPKGFEINDVDSHLLACRTLSDFAKNNNVTIEIAMRYEISSKEYKSELNFYKEIFGKNSVSYSKRVRSKMTSYQIAMDSDLIIAFHSSLLLELMGVGKKVLFYGNIDKSLRDFLGYKDFFDLLPKEILLDSWSYDEFDKKIKSLLNMKSKDYDQKIKGAKSLFMNFGEVFPHEIIYKAIEKRCSKLN